MSPAARFFLEYLRSCNRLLRITQGDDNSRLVGKHELDAGWVWLLWGIPAVLTREKLSAPFQLRISRIVLGFFAHFMRRHAKFTFIAPALNQVVDTCYSQQRQTDLECATQQLSPHPGRDVTRLAICQLDAEVATGPHACTGNAYNDGSLQQTRSESQQVSCRKQACHPFPRGDSGKIELYSMWAGYQTDLTRMDQQGDNKHHAQ